MHVGLQTKRIFFATTMLLRSGILCQDASATSAPRGRARGGSGGEHVGSNITTVIPVLLYICGHSSYCRGTYMGLLLAAGYTALSSGVPGALLETHLRWRAVISRAGAILR